MAITTEQVLQALSTVKLAASGASLTSSGRLSEIVVQDRRVMFSIAIDATEASAMEPVRKAAENAVKALPDVDQAFVTLTGDRPVPKGASAPTPERAGIQPGRPAGAPQARVQSIPGVKHVIAVASGKGGVGKSTTAVQSGARPAGARAARSACSTPTSTARRCPRCSGLPASRAIARPQDARADGELRRQDACRSASWSTRRRR